MAYLGIVTITGAALYFTWQQLSHPFITITYLSLLSFQLLLSLWRYEKTLQASFIFSACGSFLVLLGGWVGTWMGEGWTMSIGVLLGETGHYFLMHGSLHQSNLQFEIDKFQEITGRNC